jgi:hypothetical protein
MTEDWLMHICSRRHSSDAIALKSMCMLMLRLMSFGYAVELALFVVSRRIGKLHPRLVHKTLVEISKAFCGVYEVIIHIFSGES